MHLSPVSPLGGGSSLPSSSTPAPGQGTSKSAPKRRGQWPAQPISSSSTSSSQSFPSTVGGPCSFNSSSSNSNSNSSSSLSGRTQPIPLPGPRSYRDRCAHQAQLNQANDGGNRILPQGGNANAAPVAAAPVAAAPVAAAPVAAAPVAAAPVAAAPVVAAPVAAAPVVADNNDDSEGWFDWFSLLLQPHDCSSPDDVNPNPVVVNPNPVPRVNAPGGAPTSPSTSFLGWMFTPWKAPIEPPKPQPKLGLASFHWLPKQSDYKDKFDDKFSCLKPLKELLTYREAILNSINSALLSDTNTQDKLQANKSEIESAMKQQRELGELCDYCLTEYLWKPWPGNPAAKEEAELLHPEPAEKAGKLHRLEGTLIAKLIEKGLYERPKPPSKPKPFPTTAELVHKLVTDHWLFSLGLLLSSVFLAATPAYPSLTEAVYGRAIPLTDPVFGCDPHTWALVAGTVTALWTKPSDWGTDLCNAGWSLVKSVPNVALPLALSLVAADVLPEQVPPTTFIGLAGVINLVAAHRFVVPEKSGGFLNDYSTYFNSGLSKLGYGLSRAQGPIGIVAAVAFEYFTPLSTEWRRPIAFAIAASALTSSASIYYAEKNR